MSLVQFEHSGVMTFIHWSPPPYHYTLGPVLTFKHDNLFAPEETQAKSIKIGSNIHI